MTGFRGVALAVRVRPRMSWTVLAALGSVPDVEHGRGSKRSRSEAWMPAKKQQLAKVPIKRHNTNTPSRVTAALSYPKQQRERHNPIGS